MSFYSDASGNLNSIFGGGGTTVASFLTSTAGYVDTWYDQSGKGNNASQSTNISQPVFDVSSNCVDFGYIANTTNSLLTLNMPSGTVPVGALDLSYSFVVKYGNTTNLTNGGFIGSGVFANSTTNNFRLAGGISKYDNYWYSKDILWSDPSNTTLPLVSSVTYNGTTKYVNCYMNGVSKLNTSRTGMTNSAGIQKIGNTTQGNEYLKGKIYSLLIFPVELTPTDIINLSVL